MQRCRMRVERPDPLAMRQGRNFRDGPDADAEMPLAGRTPIGLRRLVGASHGLHATAPRAMASIRPDFRFRPLLRRPLLRHFISREHFGQFHDRNAFAVSPSRHLRHRVSPLTMNTGSRRHFLRCMILFPLPGPAFDQRPYYGCLSRRSRRRSWRPSAWWAARRRQACPVPPCRRRRGRSRGRSRWP